MQPINKQASSKRTFEDGSATICIDIPSERQSYSLPSASVPQVVLSRLHSDLSTTPEQPRSRLKAVLISQEKANSKVWKAYTRNMPMEHVEKEIDFPSPFQVTSMGESVVVINEKHNIITGVIQGLLEEFTEQNLQGALEWYKLLSFYRNTSRLPTNESLERENLIKDSLFFQKILEALFWKHTVDTALLELQMANLVTKTIITLSTETACLQGGFVTLINQHLCLLSVMKKRYSDLQATMPVLSRELTDFSLNVADAKQLYFSSYEKLKSRVPVTPLEYCQKVQRLMG